MPPNPLLEKSLPFKEHDASMKGFVIPTVAVIVALLYLLVGIIQHRPCFLYPFITIQVAIFMWNKRGMLMFR